MKEELFKYLIWIIGETISSFELSLFEQSLFKFKVAMSVVKSSFDRVAENFVGLRDL